MPRKKSAKPASGGKRLAASGRRPVLLGLTPEQREIIQAAAKKDSRPMTQILILGGIEYARKILSDSP